mgnify:CR=1 FL=1
MGFEDKLKIYVNIICIKFFTTQLEGINLDEIKSCSLSWNDCLFLGIHTTQALEYFYLDFPNNFQVEFSILVHCGEAAPAKNFVAPLNSGSFVIQSFAYPSKP